ncbi:nuclear transport factor 2 family protein [Rhodococcus sp. OK302]|uniref:nuclear transport factor 2 family protein n=1 Tax=Rhodococcus sp. OK302 TaxID=1882769 RepID=UPI000B9F13F5|nr:nuclear transport factor 2 family protein [Rhodococcus sp. OK302]OYD61433.1 SnoaL-like protein [Rhodococcus sp. OK302]
MSSSAGIAFKDWQAIRELTATYNRCFDQSDAVGWAGTFLESGRLEIVGQGVTFTGREQLSDFCRSRGWGILHMTLDPAVTVNGDCAEQRCNLLMFRRYESHERPTLLATGRYSDRLVRTEEGWLFEAREVQLDASIGDTAEAST